VTRTARIGLFGVSGVGLALLLVWGLSGLHPFGDYPGPYGDIIAHVAPVQRHMVNTVTAVVFDYRGFDTMGEELLLFAAASAASLLLRETRESQTHDIVDAVRSDALRGIGGVLVPVTFVLALQVVAHAYITPGGGFQGGVVLAASLAIVFLAVEYRAYNRLASIHAWEPVESFGAGAYVGLGLVSLAFGLAFLENFMELGIPGRLSAGGSAIFVNWASSLAVAGGFVVLFGEYLEDDMAARYGRGTVE
jgi:multicomponent Na+:H+ antiporter subunit B